MIKIIDIFTVKRRCFIVKEKNLIEVMKMFSEAFHAGYRTDGMTVGNCGWAEETDSWYIHANLTNNQWRELLNKCKENNYRLVIKDNPDNMCFIKIKES